MPRIASTITVGTTAANFTMPSDGGPTKITNLSSTNTIWVRLISGTAVAEGDDTIAVLPSDHEILPGGASYSMIATGAGTKAVLQASVGR